MSLFIKRDTPFSLYEVKLLQSRDEQLLKISKDMGLALNLDEMRVIKNYFTKLKRNPTDIELQTFGQTWSEHCFHKTFKGKIFYKGNWIDSLFNTFIVKATKELDLPWCISVFEDNAGIVTFEADYGIAVKIETHNHPSAIEPFGGAATGTGGVIRDILGVWADPIACTDVLCFGPMDYDYAKLPVGVKHPRYIFRGVVAGIGNYGNNMGIPTVNGGVYFDESYTGNVVVYCGCIGLLPLKHFRKETKSGDIAVLAGGRTGRDGIHGVTFASTILTEDSEESRPAVQIPNPIEEEKLTRAIRQIRDERLCSGITDLGGGGLSSAVGETAGRFTLGVEIHLEKVPLKYQGLAPWEIWISESQERMLITVPENDLNKVLKVFQDEDVDAIPLGCFNSSGILRLVYEGYQVTNLDVRTLFSPPKVHRRAVWKKVYREENKHLHPEPENLTEIILTLLSSPNISSKEDIIRTYDHEVKGNTVLKPLQGEKAGPNDAAVLKPLNDSWKGLVISCGMNPFYGKVDPYWMAASAIDEAIRNNIAVGGRRIALLDNFTWGNPEKTDQLGALVRACKACYTFAKGFGTPFISGKDSLYNESPLGPVTPTLLITGTGVIPDIRKLVSLDLKFPENPIYIIGTTYRELGGSHYYHLQSQTSNSVPKVRLREARKVMTSITKAIDSGYIKACHDLTEGGLAVSAAEMAFTGELGLEIDLRRVSSSPDQWRDDLLLFSESNSRFLVEVEKSYEDVFRILMQGVPHARIGKVLENPILSVRGLKERKVVSIELDTLYEAWCRKGGI